MSRLMVSNAVDTSNPMSTVERLLSAAVYTLSNKTTTCNSAVSVEWPLWYFTAYMAPVGDFNDLFGTSYNFANDFQLFITMVAANTTSVVRCTLF